MPSVGGPYGVALVDNKWLQQSFMISHIETWGLVQFFSYCNFWRSFQTWDSDVRYWGFGFITYCKYGVHDYIDIYHVQNPNNEAFEVTAVSYFLQFLTHCSVGDHFRYGIWISLHWSFEFAFNFKFLPFWGSFQIV